MSIYRITTDDGSIYKIEAADDATEQEVSDYFNNEYLPSLEVKQEEPVKPTEPVAQDPTGELTQFNKPVEQPTPEQIAQMQAEANPKDNSDFSRGFKTSYEQLPELGYGLEAGAYAIGETAFGEGGMLTEGKQEAVGKMIAAQKETQANAKESDSFTYAYQKAKEGDFGALADTVQYGLGMGLGQVSQAIITGGLGSTVAKTAAETFAKEYTAKLVEQEALKIAEQTAARELTQEQIQQQAVKNVTESIVNKGRDYALGAKAVSMEGGEILGDLAKQSTEQNRSLTSGEVIKGLGATALAAAGEFYADRFGLDILGGKRLSEAGKYTEGLKGNLLRGAATGAKGAGIEGGTEFAQTLIEEAGKGKDPFSSDSLRQAIDAAALGGIGGGAMSSVGGLLSSAQQKPAEPAVEPTADTTEQTATTQPMSDWERTMGGIRDIVGKNSLVDNEQVAKDVFSAETVEDAIAVANHATDAIGVDYDMNMAQAATFAQDLTKTDTDYLDSKDYQDAVQLESQLSTVRDELAYKKFQTAFEESNQQASKAEFDALVEQEINNKNQQLKDLLQYQTDEKARKAEVEASVPSTNKMLEDAQWAKTRNNRNAIIQMVFDRNVPAENIFPAIKAELKRQGFKDTELSQDDIDSYNLLKAYDQNNPTIANEPISFGEQLFTPSTLSDQEFYATGTNKVDKKGNVIVNKLGEQGVNAGQQITSGQGTDIISNFVEPTTPVRQEGDALRKVDEWVSNGATYKNGMLFDSKGKKFVLNKAQREYYLNTRPALVAKTPVAMGEGTVETRQGQDQISGVEEPNETVTPVAETPIETKQQINPEIAGNLKRGDIVVDENGKEYLSVSARHDYLEAFPIENGKADVSKDTLVTFHLRDATKDAFKERNNTPIFTTGKNLYSETPAAETPVAETPVAEPKGTINNPILRKNGKAFTSQQGAQTHIRTNPELSKDTHTWVKLGDEKYGIVTEDQVVRKPTKPAANNLRALTGLEPIETAIGKLGGINREMANRAGFSDFKGWYFTKTSSEGFDGMALLLNGKGYDVDGENDLIAKLRQSLDAKLFGIGKQVYTSQGLDNDIAKMLADREDDLEQQHRDELLNTYTNEEVNAILDAKTQAEEDKIIADIKAEKKRKADLEVDTVPDEFLGKGMTNSGDIFEKSKEPIVKLPKLERNLTEDEVATINELTFGSDENLYLPASNKGILISKFNEYSKENPDKAKAYLLELYNDLYSDKSNIKFSKAKSQQRLAPNGKPSNLNAVQYEQVRTPEFKEWFGDWENDPENASKVVDENGEPLVVYHKTSKDFTEFDKSKIGKNDYGYAGKGFYFLPIPLEGYTYGNTTIPVFLSIKKPYIRTESNWNISKLDPYNWISSRSEEFGSNTKSSNAWTDLMLENGYDGFIDKADINGEIVGFDSNQIKSATGNTGAFSKESNDIRFSKTAKKVLDENPLAIIHNLSLGNLAHADKMGGIAVPSVAIVNQKYPLSGFGEITLIGDTSQFAPEVNAKNKYFNADVYSPRYPQVTYVVDSKTLNSANESLSDDTKELAKAIGYRGLINASSIEDRGVLKGLQDSVTLKYEFLKSIGKAPKIQYKPNKTPPASMKKFISSKVDAMELKNDFTFVQAVVDIFNESIKKRNETLGTSKPYIEIDSQQASNLAFDYQYAIKEFRDQKGAQKSIDDYATSKLIREKTNQTQYEKWLVENYSNLVSDERIFNGYTSSGKRVYLPHNLDTVVKLMTKTIKGGENFSYGIGTIRAYTAKQFKTVKQIQDARGDIVSDEKLAQLKKELESEFNSISDELRPYSDYSDPSATDALSDLVSKGLRAFKESYQNVPEETMTKVYSFLDKLKNLPAHYFEGKIGRAVDIGEFSGALVPKGKEYDEAVKILNANGITKIKRYTEGDAQSRSDALLNFSDLLFGKNRQPATNTHTEQSLKEGLTKAGDDAYGKGWTDNLLGTGMFEIISDAMAQKIVSGKSKFHKVWHGTPSDFNKFSNEYMGTGEGAQAFGWGLYFTDDKDIAEWYREKLSYTKGGNEDNYTFKGEKLVIPTYQADSSETQDKQTANQIAGGIVSLFSYGNQKITQDAINEGKKWATVSMLKNQNFSDLKTKEIIAALENAKPSDFEYIRKGKLYEVELAPTQEEYLDWNKPMSQQSDTVLNALKQWAEDSYPDYLSELEWKEKNFPNTVKGLEKLRSQTPVEWMEDLFNKPNYSGEDFYKELSEQVGYDEDASRYLNSMGIRGIRFKAQGGKSDANNYVIFDDRDINIEAKYSKNGDIEAFYNPADGKTYFVAENIDKEKDLHYLMMHEVSVHMLKMGGNEAEFENFLKETDNLVKVKNPAAMQGRQDALDADTPEEDLREETLAYLIKYAPKLKIVQRFKAWLKNALRNMSKLFPASQKLGFIQWANNLSDQDLLYIAEATLRKAPEMLGVNAQNVKFSKKAKEGEIVNRSTGYTAYENAKPIPEEVDNKDNYPDDVSLEEEKDWVTQQLRRFDSFRRLNDKSNELINKYLTTMGKLPELGKYLGMRYKTLGKIDNVDDIVRNVFETLQNATKEDSKEIYTYLTDNKATTEFINDRQMAQVAKDLKEAIQIIGKKLVEFNIIPIESYQMYEGRYLPRVYLEHIIQSSDRYQSLGSGKTLSSMGYAKKRDNNLPEEVRRLLKGEVKNPAYLASRTISIPLRDIAMMEFFNQISDNEKWVWKQSLINIELDATTNRPTAIFDDDGVINYKATNSALEGAPKKTVVRKVTPYFLDKEADRILDQSYSAPEEDRKDMQDLAQMMKRAASQALQNMDAIPSDFIKMPNVAKYGSLRGLVVHKLIYDDLVGTINTYGATGEQTALENFFGNNGLLARITSAFKFSHVAVNIPTQVTNLLSNGILLHTSGVRFDKVPVRVIQAFKEVLNNGENYQKMVDMGGRKATFSNQELKGITDWLLENEAEFSDKDMDWFSMTHLFRELSYLTGKTVRSANNLHQNIEMIFKVAKFIDMKAKGATDGTAAVMAHRALFDYSFIPRWAKWLRTVPMGIPFITWTIKSFESTLRTLANRPTALLPYYMLGYALSLAASADFGDDGEDKLKAILKLLPERMQRGGSVWILPMKDDAGRTQLIDMKNLFPWGKTAEGVESLSKLVGNQDVAELRTLADAIGVFSSPITQAVVAIDTNRDAFTGKQIIDENDTSAQKLQTILEYTYGMMMPPMLGSKGDIATIYKSQSPSSYEGIMNKDGSPKKTEEQAFIHLFTGLSLKSVDVEFERHKKIEAFNNMITGIKAQRTRELRANPNLGEEERRIVREKYDARIERVQEKKQKFKDETDVLK